MPARRGKKNGNSNNIFLFIDKYNIDIFSPPSLALIRNFNNRILLAHPVPYVLMAIRDIPGSLLDVDANALPKPASPILSVSYFIMRLFQYLSILVIPALFFGWSKKTFPVQLVGLLAYGQVVLTCFAGDGMSYGRFYGPIEPLLFLYVSYWAVRSYQLLRKQIK